MQTVKIQGEDRPIKFGLTAVNKVLKLAGGKSLKDLGKLDELEATKIPKFVLIGLESGAKQADEEPPTLQQVEAELETNFPLFMEVMEIFGNDISPQNEINESGN